MMFLDDPETQVSAYSMTVVNTFAQSVHLLCRNVFHSYPRTLTKSIMFFMAQRLVCRERKKTTTAGNILFRSALHSYLTL